MTTVPTRGTTSVLIPQTKWSSKCSHITCLPALHSLSGTWIDLKAPCFGPRAAVAPPNSQVLTSTESGTTTKWLNKQVRVHWEGLGPQSWHVEILLYHSPNQGQINTKQVTSAHLRPHCKGCMGWCPSQPCYNHVIIMWQACESCDNYVLI